MHSQPTPQPPPQPQSQLQPQPQSVHSLFSLSTPRHSAPQCCLISLIQLNRLRSSLHQLREYINKELHTFKNGLSLISIGFDNLSKEPGNSPSKNRRQNEHHRGQSMESRDEKRQSMALRVMKAQYEGEREKMNIKINQLYSIIRVKNEQIETVNGELARLQRQENLGKENKSMKPLAAVRKSIDIKRRSEQKKDICLFDAKQRNINLKVTKKFNRTQTLTNINSHSNSKPKIENQHQQSLDKSKRLSISSRKSRQNHNKSISKGNGLFPHSEEPLLLRDLSISSDAAERIGDIILSLDNEVMGNKKGKQTPSIYLGKIFTDQNQRNDSWKKIPLKSHERKKSYENPQNTSLASIFRSTAKALGKTQRLKLFK